MRILGLITARSGSKGIPDKNVKHLGELPLLAYSALAAHQSKSINKTIISTDSDEYIRIAEKYGVEAPFLRPDHLSTDQASSLDVIVHALEFMNSIQEFFDAVCLLQPTSPFRPKGFIDQCIEVFTKSGADSLVSVKQVPHQYNPHWVFEPGLNGFLNISTGEKEIIKRRQDLPPAYIRDGSIYLVKTSVLLAKYSLYGEKIAWFPTDERFYVNIDNVEDWLLAEKKLPEIKEFLSLSLCVE